MKSLLKILILLLTLASCGSDGTDIREFKVKEIDFERMPNEVQEAIIEFYKPTKILTSRGDTLTVYGNKDELICLDATVKNCGHKLIWNKLVSAWLDHEELIIDNKKIIIEQSVKVFNVPFVLFDGRLYCRKNLNIEDYNDPAKDEFKVVEINKNQCQHTL